MLGPFSRIKGSPEFLANKDGQSVGLMAGVGQTAARTFTRAFWRRMHGPVDGETGIDNEIAELGFTGFGAWILGRNMFGPVRGPWPDDSWKGWWGEELPYHTPVFVLTHHPRPPVSMAGGTEFRFVTEGIHAALEQAKAIAGERTFVLAAAYRPFGSICSPGSLTICIWPSGLSYSVQGNIS